MSSDYFLGIDIGSTTFKAVLINNSRDVLSQVYQRTRAQESGADQCSGHCSNCGRCNLGSLGEYLTTFLESVGLTREDITCTVVTGSQVVEDISRFIPYDFKVSEVSAHVEGALLHNPHCRAILDVGGQDSKAMVYNVEMGLWESRMSGICAAGTGAFLDNVATKLSLPVEEIADRSDYTSKLEFSSVCAVFSATSINKFKNRYPIGEILAGACKAQARTVISGVGSLLQGYEGDILFQGGVASNRAVAHYLKEITGNNIFVPPHHEVMGALGAAILAHKYASYSKRQRPLRISFNKDEYKALGLRTKLSRKEFFGRSSEPLVWRNLFFPAEILNALGTRIFTLETYAALCSKNQVRVKQCLDSAAYKGFTAETCTFLRLLEGMDLPKPDFMLSTSEPCHQGEKIFQDLARSYGLSDRFYSLATPPQNSDATVEIIALGLQEAVKKLESGLGLKMEPERLRQVCILSNKAQVMAQKCNELRFSNPPLIRGSWMLYHATLFSHLWGTSDLVELQARLYEDLHLKKRSIDCQTANYDTHRLLWLHLPPFYDTRLIDFVELDCNAPIVFEEVNFVGWQPLDPDDPYRSLARKLLTAGFLHPSLRVQLIKEQAMKNSMNGCILYNHGFGRCSLSDNVFVKHLKEELADVNIPLLVLDGDCVDATIDPCSTRTKVSAYVEALNSKKYGNIFGVVPQETKKACLANAACCY